MNIFPAPDRRKTSALSELWGAALSGETHSELSTAMFFTERERVWEGDIFNPHPVRNHSFKYRKENTMGTVYFTRHGQTVWNVENKICGATDSPLTDLGHEQAIELGNKILAEGIHIDEILYSPLIRAKATALHVSEITGIPAREEIRLKEQNFGKYESTPRDGEEFAKAKCNFICSFEGGETMLHLAQRIYNLLDDIKARPDKTYLLVAHNGIARMVKSYFEDMGNEEFSAFKIKNCEILKFEL